MPDEHLLEMTDLRVRFALADDRYKHAVECFGDDRWRTVLTSLEGTPDEPWPASPPFQSLHVDTGSNGFPRAMLVGMAGKSHWSASVEVDAAAGVVTFDVACRIRQSDPGRLASSYRVAADCESLLRIEASTGLTETS